MAKTKASQAKARSAPSLEALSNLAKKLREQKDAEMKTDGGSAKVEPKAADPKPAVSTRVTGKTKPVSKDNSMVKNNGVKGEPKKSKDKVAAVPDNVITEEDLMEADEFDPTGLDFCLCWKDFKKLQEFFDISHRETTTILLAMVGLKPDGKQHWGLYKYPQHMFNENGVLMIMPDNPRVQKPASRPPTAVEAEAKKLELELDLQGSRDRRKEDGKIAEPPKKVRKVEEDKTSHAATESESEEDLLSSVAGSNGPDEPPPPAVDVKPMDFQLENEDGADADNLPKLNLPEPEKMSIDVPALDAKHALKESLQSVATPVKVLRWKYLISFVFCHSKNFMERK